MPFSTHFPFVKAKRKPTPGATEEYDEGTGEYDASPSSSSSEQSPPSGLIPTVFKDIQDAITGRNNDEQQQQQDPTETSPLLPQDPSAPVATRQRAQSNGARTRSSFFMFMLTLSMAGLQIAWSVELSNGSPYLLSLGMSKSFLALVWIAGPISGTLVQPYVGIRSDNCRIPWGRRRPFMLGGGLATIISLLALAWTKEIVSFSLGGTGWDTAKITIGVAVAMIYILDFSINTVQAGIRAFIVDNSPTHQQDEANAWAGRMTGVGNVVGCLSGYVDLPKHLPFFGDTQFKVLCVLACLFLGGTLLITCAFISEINPRHQDSGEPQKIRFFGYLKQILSSIRRLPPQIRKVCDAQFFAWIGWFPFLFYSTTYIGEIYVAPIYQHEPPQTPEEEQRLWEEATRAGTFALLLFAIVSLTANALLPFFVAPPQFMAQKPEKHWYSFLQISRLTMRRLWILSHFVFAISMAGTFWVRSVKGATAVVALCGIPWAVTLWAPFALISSEISKRDAVKRGIMRDESTNRLTTASENEEYDDQAGIVLGLHNVAIAAPQVIATVASSFMFKLLQKDRGSSDDNSLAWVLRGGGLMALIAVLVTKRLEEDFMQSFVYVEEDP